MASPAPSIIRVIDLETTGQAPPAHGVCEIGWQDVALQRDGRWEIHGEGGSRMVNPGRQIGPVPTHVIVDTDAARAMWFSLAGNEVVPLDAPLVRPFAELVPD